MGLAEKRAEVLKFDYWECKVCSVVIDAGTAVGNDEYKTQVLVKHVKSHHFDDPNINPKLGDDYLVLYFRGIVPPKTQDNEKLI